MFKLESHYERGLYKGQASERKIKRVKGSKGAHFAQHCIADAPDIVIQLSSYANTPNMMINSGATISNILLHLWFKLITHIYCLLYAVVKVFELCQLLNVDLCAGEMEIRITLSI